MENITASRPDLWELDIRSESLDTWSVYLWLSRSPRCNLSSPQNFAQVVFKFSRVDCYSQEKIETIFIQNFVGKTSYMYILQYG